MISPQVGGLEDAEGRWLWTEYYQAFPAFSAKTVRSGCHPRKMEHPSGGRPAIVLVHGLTDSAYFMSAIGEYFHTVLGYDVYIPLLQCHGLHSPAGMAGVSLGRWLQNIGFAVRFAAKRTARISIGGLSTGGALGYYLACTEPLITADLYLFSAALGLPAGPCALPGSFKEWLLRLPFVSRLDTSRPMVGKNPYRYDRVSLNSASELAWLMKKNNDLPQRFPGNGSLDRRIFAAWSESDKVISLDKLCRLQRRIPESRFTSFILAAADQVEHACVVLREPVYALGAGPGTAPLERANPRFAEMLASIGAFALNGRTAGAAKHADL